MINRMILLLGLIACAPGLFAATDYAACHHKKAYTDVSRKTRVPNLDWICQLSPASSNIRCEGPQGHTCEGGSQLGPHDVPNGGWAWFASFDTEAKNNVRCTCGCFKNDTMIFSEVGDVSITTLLEYARYQPISVYRRIDLDDPGKFTLSEPMRAHHFTTGTELEELYKLYFDNGESLTVTSKHPVLVKRFGEVGMLRAEETQLNDQFFHREGYPLRLVGIETLNIPVDELVYNFQSDDPHSVEHIVVANGVQVGDNKWQRYLDVVRGRWERRGLEAL